MKLAKKTLSVALAAIMAVSSATVATSALAATKFTDVKLGAATKIASTLEIDKTKDLAAQVVENSQLNYYSFTPAKSGVYVLKLTSTPLYEGKKWNTEEKAYVLDDTTSKTTYTTNYAEAKTFYSEKASDIVNLSDEGNNIPANKRVDCVALTTVEGKDSPFSGEDLYYNNGIKNVKGNISEEYYTAGYKYNAVSGMIEATNKDGENQDKTTVVTEEFLSAKLTGGQTYYFKAETFVDTEVVKEDVGSVKNKEVKKQNASSNATLTISAADWFCMEGLSDDVQRVTVPKFYITQAGEELKQEKDTYFVEKAIKYPSVRAFYLGKATAITVPETFHSKPVDCFAGSMNQSLTSITFSKNIKTIANGALDEHIRLTTVKLNDGLKTIGKNAFYGCVSLKELTIPASVETIAEDALYKTGIQSLIVKGDKTSILHSGVQYDKDGFKMNLVVTCPNESMTFYDCLMSGIKLACTKHEMVVTKAATVFAAGEKACKECGKKEAIAKLAFKPTFKAKKGAVEVKGNAGKVAKVAVWVDGKKTVKKNVTKCTVKGLKAGKHTVKVKLYAANGAKTKSVTKTVKVK